MATLGAVQGFVLFVTKYRNLDLESEQRLTFFTDICFEVVSILAIGRCLKFIIWLFKNVTLFYYHTSTIRPSDNFNI